jgi:pimeloyl-ACP methyl ester carboxylesterase
MAVIDGLGIERTRLVGMSLGGTVACEFALRHPDRTESLAMVDVTSRPVLPKRYALSTGKACSAGNGCVFESGFSRNGQFALS